MTNNPLVSVCCLAYNHAPYIRQCLDGFIMQKTNFNFEVLIHDDASTDDTADIIREYEAKYPDIIKPIYQVENQYSQGVKISTTYQFARAQGKYIALCEGDDYWIDPLKLQKQVDFLEANEDYSMCFHNAKIISDHMKTDIYPKIENRNYSGDEILKRWMVPTASVLFVREKFEDKFQPEFIFGDIVIFLTMAEKGKIYGMSDYMSVYRRLNTGMVATLKRTESIFRYVLVHKALVKAFPIVSLQTLYYLLAIDYYGVSMKYLRKNKINLFIYYMFIAIYYNAWVVLKCMGQSFVNYFKHKV